MSSTMRRTISESGVDFGPFPVERLFYIEKSAAYTSLGKSFSTVEFIYLNAKDTLCFVEAKSGSPRSDSEDNTSFDDFIRKISIKFQDSYQLFLAIMEKRRKADDIGNKISTLGLSETPIRFILVIPKHEIAWLPPIQEALNRELRKIIHIWDIKVLVMNGELAREYGMISA